MLLPNFVNKQNVKMVWCSVGANSLWAVHRHTASLCYELSWVPDPPPLSLPLHFLSDLNGPILTKAKRIKKNLVFKECDYINLPLYKIFCRQNPFSMGSSHKGCVPYMDFVSNSSLFNSEHVNLPCWPTQCCLIGKWPLTKRYFMHHYWQWTFFAHKVSLMWKRLMDKCSCAILN